jgi:hypothetical protein
MNMRSRALCLRFVCIPFICTTLLGFEDPFLGHWDNPDSHTRNITSAEIREDAGEVKVRMWGACHPNPCDWGETALEGHGKTRHAHWTASFAARAQTIKLASGGQELHVKTHTHFTDHSGRRDYTSKDVLVRKP